MKNKKEKVICIYNENAKNVKEVILEAFEKYLKIELKNNSFSASKKGSDKKCR